MQDYGDEVKDFFTVDKQLAAELEYDMRRYQEQLAEQQALVRPAAREPHTRGPCQRGPPRRPCPAGKSPRPSGGGRRACSQAAPTLMGLLWWQGARPPRPVLGRLLPWRPGQPRGPCARQCWEPGPDVVVK